MQSGVLCRKDIISSLQYEISGLLSSQSNILSVISLGNTVVSMLITQLLLVDNSSWIVDYIANTIVDPLVHLPNPFNAQTASIAFLRLFVNAAPPTALQSILVQVGRVAPQLLTSFLLLRFVCPLLTGFSHIAPLQPADLLRLRCASSLLFFWGAFFFVVLTVGVCLLIFQSHFTCLARHGEGREPKGGPQFNFATLF